MEKELDMLRKRSERLKRKGDICYEEISVETEDESETEIESESETEIENENENKNENENENESEIEGTSRDLAQSTTVNKDKVVMKMLTIDNNIGKEKEKFQSQKPITPTANTTNTVASETITKKKENNNNESMKKHKLQKPIMKKDIKKNLLTSPTSLCSLGK